MSKSIITSQLNIRKNKWSTKYSTRRRGYIEEEERKRYLPTFVNCSTVTSFLDIEKKITPVRFLEGINASRNALCSTCCKVVEENENSFQCDLCPASIHASCCSLKCEDNLSIESVTDETIDELSKNKYGNLRLCNFCVKEIGAAIYHERDRLQKDRFKRLEYFSALKMQANLMRNTAQRQYLSIYNGMLRLQARVRTYELI